MLSDSGRAKVNLTLRVVGRRVDGYHDLESVVAFADCADRLSLEVGGELHLTCTGPLAAACGETADNLVLKAAKLLAERVPGLRVGRFILDRFCRSQPGSVAVRPMPPPHFGSWRRRTASHWTMRAWPKSHSRPAPTCRFAFCRMPAT